MGFFKKNVNKEDKKSLDGGCGSTLEAAELEEKKTGENHKIQGSRNRMQVEIYCK